MEFYIGMNCDTYKGQSFQYCHILWNRGGLSHTKRYTQTLDKYRTYGQNTFNEYLKVTPDLYVICE
jgi:hypothetical protein